MSNQYTNEQLLQADKAATFMCVFQDVFIAIATQSEKIEEMEKSVEKVKTYLTKVSVHLTSTTNITASTFLDKNDLFENLLKNPTIISDVLDLPKNGENQIDNVFLQEMNDLCKIINPNNNDTFQRQIRAINNDFRLNNLVYNLKNEHDKYLDEKRNEIQPIANFFNTSLNFLLTDGLTHENFYKVVTNNYKTAVNTRWANDVYEEENPEIKTNKLWNLIQKYNVVKDMRNTLVPINTELMPPAPNEPSHENNHNYKHSIEHLQNFATKFNNEKSQHILCNDNDSIGNKFLLAVVVLATGVIPGLLLLAIHSKFFTSKNSFNFFKSNDEHFVNEIAKDIEDVSKFYPSIQSKQ